jgi:hypothetical protein
MGEWFSLDIYTEKKYSPSDITLFGIIPGYIKNDKSWEENNRIKTALLVIKTPSPSYTREPDQFAVLRLLLNDSKELQVTSVVYLSGLKSSGWHHADFRGMNKSSPLPVGFN